MVRESLTWDESRNVGPNLCRYAHPTPSFWAAWRNNKPAMKSAGFTCFQANGGWRVLERTPLAPADAPSSPASPFVPAPSKGAPAEFVSGFTPQPLESFGAGDRVWSDEQLAIFEEFRHGKQSVIVRARAGTGKSTTIKVGFSQAPEARMLYAVFNKKNQVEAQREITDPRVDVLTLHALGFRFIRGIWSNGKPDDDVEKYRVAVACGNDSPDEVRSQVLKLVGFVKNQCVAPSLDDVLDIADERGIETPEHEDFGWTVKRLALCVLKVLELSKVRDTEGRISFNDMVWLPVACGWVRACYDMVCIDEAQDMNLPQLLMARGASRGRVIVVGDDWQAIYGFRGAAADGLNMMQQALQAKSMGLTTTYRCPKAVVALAALLVNDYKAAPSAPEGEVRNISESLLPSVVQVGDAILSRANAPLMGICLKLLRKGTPARIEGKDLGKALIALVDRLNARSVPLFVTKLENWGKKQKARFENSKHFETRAAAIDDQIETLKAVAEVAISVTEIKDRIRALFQDTDGNSRPAVVLSSVHKAKGLEWNTVYMIARTFKQAKGDEEARIYYVAVTRAKATLVMASEDKQTNN